MLVLMKPEHMKEQVAEVEGKIRQLGYRAHIIPGEHSLAIGITGNHRSLDRQHS